jgi:hypothetical protein
LCNLHQSRINLALGNSLVDLFLGLPKKDWNAYYLAIVKKEQAAARARAEGRRARRRPDAKPSLDLSAYAGTYEHPAYGTARVTVEGVGLVLRWSSFKCALEHSHDDTFVAQDEALGSPLITFVIGGGGAVASMKVAEPLGVEFRKRS